MERINTYQDHPDGKFANRRLARTVVFQVLYQEELNPGSLLKSGYTFITQELPKHKELIKFADGLLDGTVKECQTIDALLSGLSMNWTLDRMSPIDRSILRLAAYEMTSTDTPRAVVINEAVELAKKFGTGESPSFVNGILDKIVKK